LRHWPLASRQAVALRAFQPPQAEGTSAPSSPGDSVAKGIADQEDLIQAITDRVMAILNKR